MCEADLPEDARVDGIGAASMRIRIGPGRVTLQGPRERILGGDALLVERVVAEETDDVVVDVIDIGEHDRRVFAAAHAMLDDRAALGGSEAPNARELDGRVAHP